MKHRLWTLAAVVVATASAALIACESKTAAAACKAAHECLPTIAFQDINKEMYPPEVLRGKVVVVNFWATWCGPCKKEIPAFNRVFHKYKDKGVVMLGVLHDTRVDDNGLLNFMSDYELTYPVVKGEQDVLAAFDYPSALPTTFVYDRAGKLVESRRGEMTEQELESLLAGIL